jgi:hypothetical protein
MATSDNTVTSTQRSSNNLQWTANYISRDDYLWIQPDVVPFDGSLKSQYPDALIIITEAKIVLFYPV